MCVILLFSSARSGHFIIELFRPTLYDRIQRGVLLPCIRSIPSFRSLNEYDLPGVFVPEYIGIVCKYPIQELRLLIQILETYFACEKICD